MASLNYSKRLHRIDSGIVSGFSSSNILPYKRGWEIENFKVLAIGHKEVQTFDNKVTSTSSFQSVLDPQEAENFQDIDITEPKYHQGCAVSALLKDNEDRIHFAQQCSTPIVLSSKSVHRFGLVLSGKVTPRQSSRPYRRRRHHSHHRSYKRHHDDDEDDKDCDKDCKDSKRESRSEREDTRYGSFGLVCSNTVRVRSSNGESKQPYDVAILTNGYRVEAKIQRAPQVAGSGSKDNSLQLEAPHSSPHIAFEKILTLRDGERGHLLRFDIAITNSHPRVEFFCSTKERRNERVVLEFPGLVPGEKYGGKQSYNNDFRVVELLELKKADFNVAITDNGAGQLLLTAPAESTFNGKSVASDETKTGIPKDSNGQFLTSMYTHSESSVQAAISDADAIDKFLTTTVSFGIFDHTDVANPEEPHRCSKCRGDGMYRGITCTDCNGTGESASDAAKKNAALVAPLPLVLPAVVDKTVAAAEALNLIQNQYFYDYVRPISTGNEPATVSRERQAEVAFYSLEMTSWTKEPQH